MLRMAKTRYEQIIAHCRSRYPKEACGLLAASLAAASSETVVAQVYPMTNVEDSPIGYSMDPQEQFRVEKEMRQRGQRLAGIYHSHTASDAYPSSVDEGLSLGAELAYVLVSLKVLAAPVLKSYRIDLTAPPGRRITEEPIAIRD